jgi:CRP/FNR family transcriptional regulator, cyclic AMP receptor protein
MPHMHHLVAGLSDADMIWLFSMGRFKTLKPGERLIAVGRPVDDLYFITHGALAIVRADGTRVAVLGEGDVIGETSFVDHRPASVSVRAEEKSELLGVPNQLIVDRLDQDPVFAARFYRALGVFLSEKLRETTALVRDLDDEKAQETARASGDRFRRLIGMLKGKKHA